MIIGFEVGLLFFRRPADACHSRDNDAESTVSVVSVTSSVCADSITHSIVSPVGSMLEAFRPWQEDSSNNKAAVHPQVNAEHCSLVNFII